MKKTTTLFLALLMGLNTIWAQDEKFSYFAESNLVVGGGDFAPFWFVSNRHGTVSSLPQDFSLRMAVFKNFEERDSSRTFFWDYAFGVDLIGAFNGKINSLHQAYVKVKYGPFGAALGNFETVYGNQDVALSSGGFGWSGNSRPMPRFDIGIPEFTAVPFTKGYVEVKGVFSNGFFADKNYVLDQNAVHSDFNRDEKLINGEIVWQPGAAAGELLTYELTYNTLLHHKNFYLRLGGKLPVNFTTGIEHYVIWGGKNTKGLNLPVNFKEFWQIVQGNMPAEPSELVGHEALNRYGEHMGQHLHLLKKRTCFRLFGRLFLEGGFTRGAAFVRVGQCRLAPRPRRSIDHELYVGVAVDAFPLHRRVLRRSDGTALGYGRLIGGILGGRTHYIRNGVVPSARTVRRAARAVTGSRFLRRRDGNHILDASRESGRNYGQFQLGPEARLVGRTPDQICRPAGAFLKVTPDRSRFALGDGLRAVAYVQ